MSTKEITISTANFDFNLQDLGYMERHIFSQYHADLAKAIRHLREMFTLMAMYPKINVALDAAVKVNTDQDGIGENYLAYFGSDSPTMPLLQAGAQQMALAVVDEEEQVFLSKQAALEMFDAFVAKYKGTTLVSGDGNDTVEFASLAHKVRVFLQLLDDRVTQWAGNVDHDEAEGAIHLSFDFPDNGLIALSLYAK